MGSRIKSLFLGNSNGTKNGNTNTQSTKKNNPHLRGHSYDTAVALEPPLKGSYPVAGNGPKNALEEVQYSRSSRPSDGGGNAAAPNVPHRRSDTAVRPQTAPGIEAANNKGQGRGRTFSIRSRRSSFFSSSRTRRNSSLSAESPPPPLPSSTSSTRDVPTYQPTTGSTIPEGFRPPFAQHNRNSSQTSHKSYVDLLDAHSNIRTSREDSRHRAKASGVRNYGEDVADRNIINKHGERDRESRLDLSSPEFSYLKSVYSPKKGGSTGMAGDSRAASALGHVLGPDPAHDDTTQGPRTNSIDAKAIAKARPPVAVPPRRNSASAKAYSIIGGRDDAPSTSLSGGAVYDRKGRRMSPLSTHSSSRDDDIPPRDPRRSSVVDPTESTSSLSRGQTLGLKEPMPVPPPTTASQPPLAGKPSPNTSAVREPPPETRRKMPSTSQSTAVPNGQSPTNRTSLPHASQGQVLSKEQIKSTSKDDFLVKGASQPPSLKGVVDLTNTVDTEVITKTLPAVTHEHVSRSRHEIRQESITREIHTHDVYHRVLPIIETEILPTKHYMKSPDGKSLIEIPESEVPLRSVTGKPNGNWQIVQNDNAYADLPSVLHRPHHHTASHDSADSPVIGLARGEPRQESRSRSRGNSIKSLLEPILSSKKEYTTAEGYPRTEYVWRHPPVFETRDGKTQPVYIGAGIGDLSSPTLSDEELAENRKSARSEEALLFRDSGYGSGGMLPGLQDRSPMAAMGQGRVVMNGSDGGLGRSVGKVKVDSNLEEKAVRRKPVGEDVAEMENGVRRMSLRH